MSGRPRLPDHSLRRRNAANQPSALHSALEYRSREEFEEQPGTRKFVDNKGCYSKTFPNRGKASTLLAGERTQTPFLPQTHLCWRINEMGHEEKSVGNCGK